MKILLPYILVISMFHGDSSTFETLFKIDIKKADNYYSDMKEDILRMSEKYHTDYKIISAIVYPELIRYSKFRDFLETKLLEALYIEKGVGDFSIGKFQMKPSFIKKMETYLEKNPDLFENFSDVANYITKIPHQIREERINRLKDVQWQIIYINCFYKIVCHKFSNLKFIDKNEQLRFFATAYNHGFDSPYDDIMIWRDKRCFPFGIDQEEENQFKYADISVYFYKKLDTKRTNKY